MADMINREDILKTDALTIGKLIRTGELTSREVTSVFIDAIKAEDSKYNSYITIAEDAVEQAEKIDEKIASGWKKI